MSKKLRCIIVDDDDNFRDTCQQQLAAAAKHVNLDIIPTSKPELAKEIAQLENGLLSARKASKGWRMPATLFDRIDIAFVDYDLLDLGGSSTISGEDVAYLLRILTTCGIIVLLNPPNLGINGFDLRLQGSLESWADFRVGSSQVGLPWLWEDSPKGFSPWAWPNLPAETARRRARLSAAIRHLDANIMETLGVEDQYLQGLDMSMAESILKSKSSPMSLRDIAKVPTTGLRRKDEGVARHIDDCDLARIASARLTAWIDRVVLPSQSFFVDGPHLSTRIPAAIAGSKASAPHKTVSRDWRQGKRAFARAAAKHMPSSSVWFTRPVWVWPAIRSDHSFDDWSTIKDGMPDFVFCEDTSCFLPRNQARRFSADVAPQFSARYASKVHGVDYRPGYRFAL